jgi:uncharacterized membrane protein YqjE
MPLEVTRMERDPLGAAGIRRDGAVTSGGTAPEPSLGELLRRLTTDTGELVRQEVSLARAEMREVGGRVARDGAKIGIALGLALAGVLALTAFLVIALGDLVGNYWLGALIVGLAMLGIGGFMAKSAVDDVKRRGITPQQTIATLKEDAAWAKDEAREVKRELTR